MEQRSGVQVVSTLGERVDVEHPSGQVVGLVGIASTEEQLTGSQTGGCERAPQVLARPIEPLGIRHSHERLAAPHVDGGEQPIERPRGCGIAFGLPGGLDGGGEVVDVEVVHAGSPGERRGSSTRSRCDRLPRRLSAAWSLSKMFDPIWEPDVDHRVLHDSWANRRVGDLAAGDAMRGATPYEADHRVTRSV
jgi:hypothetical protein